MTFWCMLLYPDIFNYLMFFPSEFCGKDLNDYKNSEAYSYHKSGCCNHSRITLNGECRKSQS